MNIKYTRKSHYATEPRYAHAGDAALDLYAAADTTIAARGFALVQTDIAMAIPNGFFGSVRGRSGNTIKRGILVADGTIDSGYRGSIGVMAFNYTDSDIIVNRGERIGQLIVQYAPAINLKEVDSLPDTERGNHGFGSSGK